MTGPPPLGRIRLDEASETHYAIIMSEPARRTSDPAPSPRVFSELRDLQLTPRFLAGLERLMARLAAQVDWPTFSKIPRVSRPGSPVQRLRDLASVELGQSHGFLGTGTSHEASRALALLRVGPRALRLFDLLCCNLAVDARELEDLLPEAERDALVADGVLLELGPAVMMTASIIPYGERWYVGDGWHLKDHAEAYGLLGAPVGYDTWLQIEYLRQRLAAKPAARMLEVGPGLGIVLHELASLVDEREGAEYDPRTLAFARANLTLHRDERARVFESDLLSGASGHYDLIVFNPWQPSEQYFPLIERFVEQAAAHLTPGGAVSLLLNTRREGRREPLMEQLSAVLARLGLVAERDVVQTFATTMPDGSPALRAQHFCWLTRGASRAGANITDLHNLSWLTLEARGMLAR